MKVQAGTGDADIGVALPDAGVLGSQSISQLKLDEESAAVLQSNAITETMLTSREPLTKKFFAEALRKLDHLIHNV